MQRCPQTLDFLPSPPLPPWAYGQYIHRKNPEKIERPWKGLYLRLVDLVDLVVFDILFLQKKNGLPITLTVAGSSYDLVRRDWVILYVWSRSILPKKPRMKPVNNRLHKYSQIHSTNASPPLPTPIKKKTDCGLAECLSQTSDFKQRTLHRLPIFPAPITQAPH